MTGALTAAADTFYMERADSADVYMRRERWADAERVLLQALRSEPANSSNALLLSNLGVAQTHLGHTADAMRSFDAALGLAPRSSAVLANRARAHLADGHRAEALSDLCAALALDSLNTSTLRLHGYTALSLNKISDARKSFVKITTLSPPDADIQAALAQCAEAEGNHTEAIARYTDALLIDPDNTDLLQGRASAYIATSQLTEASDDLYRAITLSPRQGSLYALRSILNRMRYLNSEADADLQLAAKYGADPELIKMCTPKSSSKAKRKN